MTMKPPVHRIEMRAYSHPSEDLHKVAACMTYLNGSISSIDDWDISLLESISVSKSESYHGARIYILDMKSNDKNEIAHFLENVARENGVYFLISVLGERMDDNCTLHLRFDKDRIMRALENGTTSNPDISGFHMVEGDNIVKVMVKVAAYPAKKDVAIKEMKTYLEEVFSGGREDNLTES